MTRPAFPCQASPDTDAAQGLSKLEYFAAAALSGILAGDTEGTVTEEKAVKWAVSHARALITELQKPAD